MDKTLTLHIGHFKTGTTALQVFLQRSGRFLAKNGLQYPDVWMHNAKHSAFAFSIYRAAGIDRLMYDYGDPTPPERMWADLFDRVMQSPEPGTIVSSEEFMRLGGFPAAQSILGRILDSRPAGLRIRAIAYLRPPAAAVTSWYNQLVKMSFPVADLNAAMGSDLEAVHFDYRLAIEPWQRLLGPENVIVRPYIRDPAAPDALHRDFMAQFGVTLPKDFVKIERDPNPRFDDRVLELVRLMQNLDFPRGTINAVRTQALAYLEAQDAQVHEAAIGMETVRERAREGLEWLSGQTGSTVPAQDYAHQLPEPVPPQVVERNLLMGFIFSEFIQLRQRVNAANLPDLDRRFGALEERLSRLEGNA